jgi:hypothetical protein
MFNSNDGYSLADIAAATGNGYGNDGFFGGSGWWIILLFLFAWGGWGNNGWGNGGNGAGTTILGLDSLASTRDGFYDLNTSILNGFASTTAAVTNGTSAIQSDICNMGMQNLQNTNLLQQAINSNTIAGMQNTFGITNQLSAM